jgi:hypothetical protein
MEQHDAAVNQRRTQLFNFTPHESGILRGFCEIALAGMKLHGCTVHVQGTSAWVNSPGKPVVDTVGNVAREQNGKLAYAAVISFRNSAIRRRFSDAILACLSEAGIQIVAEAEDGPLLPFETENDCSRPSSGAHANAEEMA